jgi:hypothetical protein
MRRGEGAIADSGVQGSIGRLREGELSVDVEVSSYEELNY